MMHMTETQRTKLIVQALMDSQTAIFFQGADSKFAWIENPQGDWSAEQIVGKYDKDFFDELTLSQIGIAKNEAHETGNVQTIDVCVGPSAGQRAEWFKLTYKALVSDGELEGFIGTAVEITDERQRAETLKALLREVSHRSKNMLSMVLSLAAQTSRRSASKDAFMRSFTGRVQSLAKSQDVVVAQDWRGAKVSELIDRQVRNVVPTIEGQIVFSGDDLELTPNGATHAGLALHELCTNALAYGALASAKGKIHIECTRLNDGKSGAELVWTEGPVEIAENINDTTSSFGRTVLERVVPAAVGGTGVLLIADKKVRYRLRIGTGDVV
jgi:two-component sensor histidine kinase